jgi:hypothetical protein
MRNLSGYILALCLFPGLAFAQSACENVPHGYVDGVCFELTAAQIAAQAATAETPPAPAQAAATAFAAGIVLTSLATPSLNGTYALDQASQNHVNATISSILLNGTFPGGGSTIAWVDASRATHTFPSVAEFRSFATAYTDYIAAVSLYAESNGAVGALPSNQITIP